jgi:hypothetical protein
MPMIPRVWIAVLAATLAIADTSCRRRPAQGAAHTEESDTAFAAMQARGAMVMGVDQYTSHHVFEDLPDGGRIVLDRDAASDTAAIRRIRQHMRDIAAAFALGDFSQPLEVHGMPAPGSAIMTARRAAITYEEVDRPQGAEVRIHTTDAVAVAAVHEFLAFQRDAHHAAGHEGMMGRAP